MSAVVTVSPAALAERLRQMSERPNTYTVGEIIEKYLEAYAGRDNRSLRQRLHAWDNILGEYTLEKITVELVHAVRAEIASQPALAFKGTDHQGRRIFKPIGRDRLRRPATINRYVGALSSLLTFAIDERLAPRGWINPCRGIKRLKGEVERVRFLDDDERGRLLAACKLQVPTRGERCTQGARYPRLHALVLMALLTGARRGELLGLKWRDVDLAAGRAYLERTKNGERRVLILLPEVVATLKPFVGEANRYVFGSVQSRYTKSANIDTAWHEAVKRARLEDFRFHDLRHCCASYLAQKGVPLNVIADVLGHKKLDMTQRYAHLVTETKEKAMREALGGIAA